MKEPLMLSDRTYAAIVGLLIVGLLVALAIVEAVGADARRRPPSDGPWMDYIASVDEAIGANDHRAARWALDQAYSAALRSRRWDGMLAVGDAAARVGDLARARTGYLTAAYRAQQARNVEGVLHAAEAFAMLGDRDVVDRVLAMARQAAGRDAELQATVRAASERLVEHSAALEAQR